MAVVSKNNVLIDQSMDVVHSSWASFKWTLYTDVVPVRWISSGWILSSSGLPVSVTQERTIVSVNQSCKCKWWSPGLTQHMRSGSTTTAEISTHVYFAICNAKANIITLSLKLEVSIGLRNLPQLQMSPLWNTTSPYISCSSIIQAFMYASTLYFARPRVIIALPLSYFSFVGCTASIYVNDS